MSESTEKVWDLWQEVFESDRERHGLKRSVSFPGRNVKKFYREGTGESVLKNPKSTENETKRVFFLKKCSKTPEKCRI